MGTQNGEDASIHPHFEQLDGCVIYDDIKLFDPFSISDFMDEKSKLEQKLDDAMVSYEHNNSSYLSKIILQFRTQKLEICEAMKDEEEKAVFLKKLQNDLQILDVSLNSLFKVSQRTLHAKLSGIHHQRLRDFAFKWSKRNEIKPSENEIIDELSAQLDNVNLN